MYFYFVTRFSKALVIYKLGWLSPCQGILYPLAYKQDKLILENFIGNLKEIAPTVWLNQSWYSRTQVCDPGIKVQTIHSAKGLQYRVVIILWSDLLPTLFADSDEETHRKLLYVGLTRAEDFLLISSSRHSQFIDQIAESNKVTFASYKSDTFMIYEDDPQNREEELKVMLNNFTW